jgi:hypothetical protein
MIELLRRMIEWALPGENPAGVIYGLVMIGAVLAAESGLHDTYIETVGSAVLTVCVYWLAHAYADLLGRRLAEREHLTTQTLLRALAHDWAIVRGTALPLLALVSAWAADAPQSTAILVAVWTCAGSLVAFELVAGLRAKSTPAELVLEVCVGTIMGLSIVALRAILH